MAVGVAAALEFTVLLAEESNVEAAERPMTLFVATGMVGFSYGPILKPDVVLRPEYVELEGPSSPCV